MSDFGIEDAFHALIERLVDAERRHSTAEGRAAESREREVAASRNEMTAQATIGRLEREARDAVAPLTELWEAAKDAAEFFRATYPAEARTPDLDQIKRLQAALDAAGVYCGQPPF